MPIYDESATSRITAVNSSASAATQRIFGAIEAAVDGNKLKDTDLTKRCRSFEAYGALAVEAGSRRSRKLLVPRAVSSGGKTDPEPSPAWRWSLGKIRTPRGALRSLQKVLAVQGSGWYGTRSPVTPRLRVGRRVVGEA